jgi:hypothetical protein
MGTPPLISPHRGSPLPYPPFYRGFLGWKGGIIPSKKSWKKIYKKGTPYIKCSLYMKNKFLEKLYIYRI